MIKNVLFALCVLAVTLSCAAPHATAKKKYSVLIYSKTAGYHHASIAAGIKAIQKLGTENNFAVDSTTDSTYFTPQNLKKYNAIIFLSTTMNVLDINGQAAFEKYIQSGGGYVGVHAASDTEYDWPWYNKLVGAQFKSHPKQQEAVLHVVDTTFIATKHLPSVWKRWDEWYNFKNLMVDSTYHVLITIDESSYKGGENGDFHPMAWYHNFDGGRAFYTELGHTDESYADPLFLNHLLGGINYAIGKKP
ncbi:ThuA domain-containing protein [Pinibacter soli]|uniref:ThuA domain-containing protein n=1 Tax=Pinibacter soli TaxID=3044211 RepID=A0ABT6RB11_9BACT|nr:ThuA domain-containing protein [Pinibacter soli]MDI3319752.1 ThuA domain-containing protein [Pinibacter soli]